MMTIRRISLLALLFLAAAVAWATKPSSVGSEMAGSAQRFLAALSPEQRTAACFAFDDDYRTDWHFIPRARKGVPLKTMTPEQQKLAHAWVATGLSPEAYAKAKNVIALESVLHHLENQNP